MSREEDYRSIIDSVKEQGFFAFTKIHEGLGRLCYCVNKMDEKGNYSGTSFMIGKSLGHFYVATWVGDAYLFPDANYVNNFCIEALNTMNRCMVISDEMIIKYGLILIPEEYFEGNELPLAVLP